jgi:methionine-R-sulfoxide reductase
MRRPAIVFAAVAAVSIVTVILSAAAPRKPTKASEKSKEAPKMVQVYVFDQKGQLVGPVESPKLVLSDKEWREKLTPAQFKILRAKGTERAFCGTLLDNKQEGVYTCAGCGLPLFSSDAKFHSGTGWPSYFQPIAQGNVVDQADHSHGTTRDEILCARCGGHLGHVFDDGPAPTHLRFCLNSESLTFTPQDKLATLADPAAEKTVGEKKTAAAPSGASKEKE